MPSHTNAVRFITLCHSSPSKRQKQRHDPKTPHTTLQCKQTMNKLNSHLPPTSTTNPLPPPPLHNALQLPPQRILHLLLPSPFPTQSLHPTARHDRKSHRLQRRSFPTFLADFRSQPVGDAEAGGGYDGVGRFDAHFRKEIEVDGIAKGWYFVLVNCVNE